MTAAETPRSTADAAEQLKRLMEVLPQLEDDRAHDIDAIAQRIGVPAEVVMRDLRDLVTRQGNEPGGFVEGIQLSLDATSVRLEAPGFFRRPMGLSPSEMHALELGLAMLAQEVPAEERTAIEGARQRLRDAMTMPIVQPLPYAVDLESASDDSAGLRQAMSKAAKAREVLSLTYHAASRDEAEDRRVEPLTQIHRNGRWYLIAWCLREDGLRVFRLDRVVAAETTGETFEWPSGLSPEDVVRDGNALASNADETLRIRYSARIARWIAERESVEFQDDGSVLASYPLADEDWAVRHVLQYGAEATVLEPARIRERVVTLLASLSIDAGRS